MSPRLRPPRRWAPWLVSASFAAMAVIVAIIVWAAFTTLHRSQRWSPPPWHTSTALALSPDGQTLYVTNGGYWRHGQLPRDNLVGDTVTPVDTTTHRAGTPIRVPTDPEALAITPDGRKLYVLQGIWYSPAVPAITPLDLATGRAGTPLRFPGGAGAMVMSPDGRTLYVASQRQIGETIPVSVASDREGKPIQVLTAGGDLPIKPAITPDGATLFTTAAGQQLRPPPIIPYSSFIVGATDTRTGRTRSIPLPTSPASLGVSPDGQILYVLGDYDHDAENPGPQDLFPVSIATGKAGKPIRLPALPLNQMAISPDGQTMYLAGSSLITVDGTYGPGPVIRLSLATGRAQSLNTPLRDAAISALAISPDGRTLYVADSENVAFLPVG